MNNANSDIWRIAAQTIGTALEQFKFCPFCGAGAFSNQLENYLQCSSCEFVYYVNPPVSVVAVLKNEQGQLLLSQRKFDPGKGKYDFPGGFVDTRETLEVAIAREIKEELNLELEDVTYINSFVTTYPYKGVMYYPVDAVFECNIKNWNTLKVQDDVAAIRFVSAFDIKEDDLAFESHKLLVQSLKKSKNK